MTGSTSRISAEMRIFLQPQEVTGWELGLQPEDDHQRPTGHPRAGR